MIKQQAMEAYVGEDVLLHILDLCTWQTERNGQFHTPTALPMGKKPFPPIEQKALSTFFLKSVCLHIHQVCTMWTAVNFYLTSLFSFIISKQVI